jgi:hypothetical protein
MLFTMYQQQLHPLQGLEVCAGLVLVLGAVPTAARMRPYYCSALYGGGACLQRPHSDTQDDGTAFMVL